MSSTAAQAPRSLGLADVTLFMVTAGSSLQWTAVAAAAGPSSLIVWMLGGLGFFLPLAVCVVWLASRYPDEGGLYAWTGRAFGPFAGFMTGWTYWTGTLAFLPSVLYFCAGSARLLAVDSDATSATPAWFIGFSVAALALAVTLNVRGMAVARWLNSAGAVARWLGTLLLVVLALASWWRFGPATAINARTIVPEFRLADVIFWTTLAFCWTGPEAASYMGGEIREPRRTVPRALALAAPMIAAIYIVGTASLLLAIPPQRASGVYGVMEGIRAAAARLGLAWLIPLGAACVVLDRIGSSCLWIGALARIPLAAGFDHHLPRSFTRLDARGSPVVAIWTQAIVVALLVIIGQSGTSVRGAYNVLIEMMVVTSMLPYLLLFAATIRLARGAAAGGGLRVAGGRATLTALAVVGFATTAASLMLAFLPPPEESNPALAILKVGGLTAVLLGGGALIYVIGSARARRAVRV
ncbi:MAG TPA: APC family permease [Steroidobacteraceae bacterium]|nr:APC family permease [Steroidobacteraceae bacterium]